MRTKGLKALLKMIPLVYGLPLLVSAQTSVGTQGVLPAPVQNLGQIGGLLCTIALWLFNILIFVAIIFAIYAAFLYLTAGGEEEKIKKANHTLIYVVVAIVVAIIARGVPTIVGSLTGATGIFSACS